MNIGELNAWIDLQADRFNRGVDEAERRFNGMADGLARTAKVLGATAGAALGAGLAMGMKANMEIESTEALLEAQLGAHGEVAGKAGEVAGQLYADGYGDSMAEVGQATKMVVSNIQGMGDATNAELGDVTGQVMSLARTLETDVGGATQAVSSMLSTGVAGSAQEAMDILTAGAGTSANKMGDLGESFNEYSTNFRTLGLSGAEALGLMQQATDNGAMSSDKAADALAEFSKIATEDVKRAGEGFEALGMDTDTMMAALNEGGPAAQAALQQTLDKLREMPPGTDKATASMALFGTQGEDMAAALGAMDLGTATDNIGQVEAASRRADDALMSTAEVGVKEMQRSLQLLAAEATQLPGPLGAVGTAAMAFGPGLLTMLGPIALVIAAQRQAAAAAAASGGAARASWVRTAAAATFNWLRIAAVSTAGAIKTAAAWVIAMGPVGWVIAAVIGLVALIVMNWDRVKAFTAQAWGAIVGFVTGAATNVRNAVVSGVSGAYNAAVDWLGRAQAWISGLPGRVMGALGNLGGFLTGAGRSLIMGFWTGIQSAFAWVKGKVSGLLGGLRNLLPFSPAKEGPFSGSGYTTHSGKAMMRDLGKGIDSESATVHDALAGAMSRAGGALDSRTRVSSRRRRGGDGPDAEAMYRAVRDAMDGSRMSVDGRGVARLVNRRNQRDRRRGGGNVPAMA